MRLSFKCRMYGDRPHDPCSGTTDDGSELPCECPCHGTNSPAVRALIEQRRGWLVRAWAVLACVALARCKDWGEGPPWPQG